MYVAHVINTHFANNVVDVCNLCPQKQQILLDTCLTNFKSVNNKEWLCLSCKCEIYAGMVPKLSTTNKVGFPKKPPELELNVLEEFLAAPLSAFMRIRSLPVWNNNMWSEVNDRQCSSCVK